MTNVAIIGCGYVGTRIAAQWQQAGYTVTATTTRAERIPEIEPLCDRAIILNSQDRDTLKRVLHDQDAVLVAVAPSGGRKYAETYLPTAEAIAAVAPQMPRLQQLIYTSTYSVYGNYQGDWVTEETPVRPATPNSEQMVAAEQTCLQIPTLKTCILRLGGIYGPGRTLERIFSRWAGKIRPGDGSRWSNWIHVDDIVGAIAFAQAHQLSGIYNVVQDEILRARDLLAQVCDRHNLEPVAWDASQPDTRTYSVQCSNQKLKDAGYQFVHPQFW
ncbi:MAG: SDR family oxidoreductase [Spirulina sp. SIO3F2]|nr:SDR family oxidoreductase [Spirulina sp. SIO3F2]